MNPWVRWTVLPLVGFGATTWVGYGWLFWTLQDSLLFPAPGGIDRTALDMGAREVGADPIDVIAADGTSLYAWHYRQNGRRLVIYFPGNAETVAGNIGLHRELLNHQWDVLALAYRGYPGSSGQPSEQGLALDAEAIWDWALNQGYAPDTIVLHGRSLGGGVAAHLAERRNPAALVLDSSFRSIRAIARRWMPLHPVGWLLRHPFDTEARAPMVGVPTLIVHSTSDRVIPLGASAYAIRSRFAESEAWSADGYRHEHCLTVADPEIQRHYLAFIERIVPADPR